MKIYTGSGDRGKTGLFSGERVFKDDPRIEACGDIDELNSILGALLTVIESKDLTQEIHRIQSDLMHISGWLATAPDTSAAEMLTAFSQEKCRYLESSIDQKSDVLSDLTRFILPGGHPSATWAHLARTVCRRAERRMVRLSEGIREEKFALSLSAILAFMNRLSDYLFVLARYCNHLHGIPDIPWEDHDS